MTTTLAAVLVLLDGTAPASDVIALTPEITRMTAGTEWRVSQLVGIIATVDATAYRSGVTPLTTRIPSVIARVVTPGVMPETARRPAVCCMTHVTLFSSV